jgi:hypothetical protein
MGDEITWIRSVNPENEILNLPLGNIIRMGCFARHPGILQWLALRIESETILNPGIPSFAGMTGQSPSVRQGLFREVPE